jgi:hypothetical protein
MGCGSASGKECQDKHQQKKTTGSFHFPPHKTADCLISIMMDKVGASGNRRKIIRWFVKK